MPSNGKYAARVQNKSILVLDVELIAGLGAIVGSRHVLSRPHQTERYRKGFRSGEGIAAAVVRPGTLLEMWRVLQACVTADCIIIMQAANTGLTEGSTPSGTDYDRPVVIISTLRLDRIDLLNGGEQILSLAGATLYRLEDLLRPLGRQPHSVIGSSCIGASIVGGISNNSGGTLIQRGPAYTELSLYAQLDADSTLRLVNELGLDLGTTPESILGRLDRSEYRADRLTPSSARSSDTDYANYVRQIEASTPARYNADPRRLHSASGCAGKLAVFAVRMDTFAQDSQEAVFHLGTNDPAALTRLRRHMLANFDSLPVAAEYMHRDALEIARLYGKDTFLLIDRLGTKVMPWFFSAKGRIDAVLDKLSFLPKSLLDRTVQLLAGMLPEVMPRRLMAFHCRYEHHLLLKMGGKGIAEAKAYLAKDFGSTADQDWFSCSAEEGRKAFLLRFAIAGAAMRYALVHDRRCGDMVPFDIALPRNSLEWLEILPAEIDRMCEAKLYYGHFFCHVFHQDYVLRKGMDATRFKSDMRQLFNERKAEYPAEHNIGHLYAAKPSQREFFLALDPTNSFNPGIGKLSKLRNFAGGVRSKVGEGGHS